MRKWEVTKDGVSQTVEADSMDIEGNCVVFYEVSSDGLFVSRLAIMAISGFDHIELVRDGSQ